MRNTKGFTLIELLIVVVIIGILAAIALPQFASTKAKAFDSSAKSDIRNMMTAQEAYFADFQSYVATTIAAANPPTGVDLDNDGNQDFQASPEVGVDVTIPAGGGYKVTASHTQGNSAWCVNTDPTATAPGVIQKGTAC